jgi:signal transduction histidine kinase
MEIAEILSARSLKNPPTLYALAFLATLLAGLIRRPLNPLLGDYAAYVTFFPAVAFSAWYCGLGPSIMSVVLTLLSARYWLIPPADRFQIPSAAHLIGMLVFLFASGVIVALGEGSRRKNERLERAQAESEERVRQRTAELDAANHSLRELTARLLQLQDDERRRIARELHDSVGQTLAVLAMNLSAVGADIDRLVKTASAITDSRELVHEMSENIRTISYLLHPPLLDEKGLSSALRWYIEGFAERSRIEVDLELPDDIGRLPRDLETAIFRVVQECLTNIHRHSGSASAKIRIRCSARDISVEIRDKGKGMPPEKRYELAAAGTPGVGIRGMQERIRQLGGSLEIHSDGIGKGTLVVARLPLVAAAAQAASTA